MLTQGSFASAILTQVTPSQGNAVISGSSAPVTLGTLASGATATVTFNVTPTELGSLAINLGVTTTSADPTPGNNTAAAKLTVGPPADVTLVTTPNPSIEVGAGTRGATSGCRF